MNATTAQPNTKKNLIGILIVGTIICLLAVCVFAAVFYLFPSEPNTMDEYLEKYGGNPDVYQRILNGTDCSALQKDFDQAETNLSLQSPGTPQYKWGLGYMAAADQRMEEIGCYE